MKRIVSVIMTAFIIVSCFCFQAFAEDKNILEMVPYAYGYIKPEAINVRSGPGKTYDRIGGLTSKDIIFILEKDYSGTEYWYMINYDGKAGYVLASEIFIVDSNPIVSFCTYSDSRIEPEIDPLFITNVEPVKSGYTFMGWSLTKGSDKVDFKPMQEVNFKENTMLYAVWRAPTFPSNTTVKVGYNSNVTAVITVDNVPYGCSLNVDGMLTNVQEAGCGKIEDIECFNNVTSDVVIKVCVVGEDGYKIDGLEFTVTIKPNNSFFGKISAFFSYVFNGFKWKTQTVYFN